MSAMPFYDKDGHTIDHVTGKRVDQIFDDIDKLPQGRLGNLFEQAAAVASGSKHAHSRLGKLIGLFANLLAGDSHDSPSVGSDLPENGGISGLKSASAAAGSDKVEGTLARLKREQREAEEARNPEGAAVTAAINNTARALGVSSASLMEAITTANNHVVPGQKSHALEEAAGILVKKPEELVAAGRKHGFTMEDGKIIVDVDAARATNKISSRMLDDFVPAQGLKNRDQGKINDDMPQGARVANLATSASQVQVG